MNIKDEFKFIAKAGISIVAVLCVIVAVATYRNDVVIKRAEIVNNLYGEFDNKDIDKFYGLFLANDTLKINPNSNSKNEMQLNKILTLFDKVHNYYEQGIIDDKALSYIACKILNFYNHPCVIGYINKLNEECEKAGYSKDIRPFSGFTKLGRKLSKKYQKIKSKGYL